MISNDCFECRKLPIFYIKKIQDQEKIKIDKYFNNLVKTDDRLELINLLGFPKEISEKILKLTLLKECMKCCNCNKTLCKYHSFSDIICYSCWVSYSSDGVSSFYED